MGLREDLEAAVAALRAANQANDQAFGKVSLLVGHATRLETRQAIQEYLAANKNLFKPEAQLIRQIVEALVELEMHRPE